MVDLSIAMLVYQRVPNFASWVTPAPWGGSFVDDVDDFGSCVVRSAPTETQVESDILRGISLRRTLRSFGAVWMKSAQDLSPDQRIERGLL